MSITISFTLDNANNVLLLMALHEILENGENLDVSNVVSRDVYDWLLDEIEEVADRIRE